MRRSEELLAYMDKMYVEWLDRPWCYFATPEALESTFCNFERMREFVLGKEEWSPVPEEGYMKYLHDKRLTLGKYRQTESEAAHYRNKFADAAARVRGYLQSPFRLSNVSGANLD